MLKRSNQTKKNKTYFVKLVCLLMLLSGSSSAANVAMKKENVIALERKIYYNAERLLHRTSSSEYKKLYKQLDDYPLQPYLKQQELFDNISLKKENEIDVFLTKYRSSPLDWRIRKKWLRYLVKKNKSSLFLKYYKPNGDVALNCQKLIYEHKENYPQKALLEQISKLWTVGKSQHKTCDPLFKMWEKAGYRTNELILKRISLAADGGKHTLIPYLTTLLPQEQQYLGSLWHKVRKNPVTLSKQKYFLQNNTEEAKIMTYGLKRLIWRDPNLALKSYKKNQNDMAFTSLQKNEIAKAFAIALSSKQHKEASNWLDKIDDQYLSSTLIQWQITDLLKQQNWQAVINAYHKLPKSFQENIQWQYWYARALRETNQILLGNNILSGIADQRHYYGFLAATHLEKPVSLQKKPIVISEVEKQKVLSYSSAKRAFELYKINRPLKARSEWNFLLTQLNDREKMVVSVLAYEKNWFDRAIFTLAEVGYLDDVDLRFPKGYQVDINKYATKQKINPAWAFAIARRESSFMPDVSSSAGAEGLMQVLPSTASMLRRKKISKNYLFDVKNNIKSGTHYLKRLLDKNNGNQVLATASYNAGPYKVKKWIKNLDKIPADIWIETIPYKETRNYVKSVLAYQEIYQHQSTQVSNLFESLINMKIGH